MVESSDKDQRKNKVTEVRTFPVPFALEEIKKNITITTNTPSKPSKEQIINQAFKFHSQGNIKEAARYYQHFIDEGFRDYRVFSNYGVILTSLGKLKEAEKSTRKAIEIKPDYAEAHSNLGLILNELGKLQEAELSIGKAIEIKSDYPEAHSNLGLILNELGKSQEAELSLRKAIEIKPDFAMGYYHLSRFYSKENAYSKAYKEINLALKYDSKNHIIQGELNRLKFITDE